MKEIGGYFQLEEMPGEEYYPDLYRSILEEPHCCGF